VVGVYCLVVVFFDYFCYFFWVYFLKEKEQELGGLPETQDALRRSNERGGGKMGKGSVKWCAVKVLHVVSLLLLLIR
jgi:hypothetical protein